MPPLPARAAAQDHAARNQGDCGQGDPAHEGDGVVARLREPAAGAGAVVGAGAGAVVVTAGRGRLVAVLCTPACRAAEAASTR